MGKLTINGIEWLFSIAIFNYQRVMGFIVIVGLLYSYLRYPLLKEEYGFWDLGKPLEHIGLGYGTPLRLGHTALKRISRGDIHYHHHHFLHDYLKLI